MIPPTKLIVNLFNFIRMLALGNIHKVHTQNFWDFGPPPPSCMLFTQPISTVVRKNWPYLWPPLSAYVLYGWSLTVFRTFTEGHSEIEIGMDVRGEVLLRVRGCSICQDLTWKSSLFFGRTRTRCKPLSLLPHPPPRVENGGRSGRSRRGSLRTPTISTQRSVSFPTES